MAAAIASLLMLLPALSVAPAAALTPDELLGKIFPHANSQHPKRSRMKPPVAKAKPPVPAAKPETPASVEVPAAEGATKVGAPPSTPPLPAPSPAVKPAEPSPEAPDAIKPPLPEPDPRPEPTPSAEAAAPPMPAQKEPLLPATIEPTAPLGEPRQPAGTVVAPADALGPVIPPVQIVPVGPPSFTAPPASAETAPGEPVPKPQSKPDEPPAASKAPPRQMPSAEELATCRAGMATLAITATAEPPLVEGECGAPDPFTVTALEAGSVKLAPAATIDCAMASALASWITDDVQPAAKAAFGAEATTIDVAGSYACRGRNNVEGARLSEHAFANAIDIAGFEIDHRTVTVARSKGQSAADAAFIETIRLSACRRFTTVLGPGSDVEHASHLHLDAIKRGRTGDYRICE